MYLNFFKLCREPFTLSPNLDLYCELPEHQAAMTLMHYGLKQGECLMKVTGDVGVGKTLLCRKLLESLDSNTITCYVFNPYLSAEELLRAIATDMGIEDTCSKQRFDLVTVINEHLIDCHKLGKKVVVIIDESHLLTDEALELLRLLTNLETSTEKLLHIILVGQEELNERLKRPALRQINQRISYSYRLGGISRDNIEKYLSRRLLASGHTSGYLFSRQAISLLYRASAGVPRVINILSNKAMLASFGLGENSISRRAMQRAIKDSQDLIRITQCKIGSETNWLHILLPVLALSSVVAVIYFGMHI